MPSTHAKAGFAEGQSVQGVMWAKDFIVWCFNRFPQRRRCSLFAVFLLEYRGKDSANREQSLKLACKLCRGAAYLGLGGKDSANREQSLKFAYKLCRGAAYLDHRGKVMY